MRRMIQYGKNRVAFLRQLFNDYISKEINNLLRLPKKGTNNLNHIITYLLNISSVLVIYNWHKSSIKQ